MESWLLWGTRVIQSVQALGNPALDALFKAITFVGDEKFALLVVPFLYWSLNKALAVRAAFLYLGSAYVNTALKALFAVPRPSATSVRVLESVEGYSFPSGHAQTATTVWGYLATQIRQRWFQAVAVVLIILVGLSRVYLAVHFPTDVLAGWLIGAVLLWASLKVEPIFIGWFKHQSQVSQYLIVLATSLGIIFLGWLIRLLFSAWELPAEWILNASSAFPEEPPLDPFRLSGLVTAAGSFLGLTSGAIYLVNRGGWSTQGSPMQLAARYIIGVVGVLVIYIGLDLLFPDGEDLVAFCFRYIRYALVGLWVSALAPLIFRRIRLAVNLP